MRSFGPAAGYTFNFLASHTSPYGHLFSKKEMIKKQAYYKVEITGAAERNATQRC